MRIKVALLDEDLQYIERLTEAFQKKYSDTIEVYLFTNESSALQSLNQNRIDVFVANEIFDIDVQQLPKRCGFSYFVETNGIESVRGEMTIPKYQKVDLIYKQILGLYSEKVENISGLKYTDTGCKILAFMPASGGVGASTMAAACATAFAQYGKRVLYLNLETFGSADSFFVGEGQYDMSDMIYALKSRKGNIGIKLKSIVRQSSNGVFFFSKAKVALDIMELKTEEKIQLISEIQSSGDYDYLILDLENCIHTDEVELLGLTHEIVLVSDGSSISNEKLNRLLEAVQILEKNMDVGMSNRMVMYYNKYSNKTSQRYAGEQIQVLGGAPRFEHATVSDIVGQLAGMDLFDKLI